MIPVSTLISEGMYWGNIWDILRNSGYELQGMEADSWSAAIFRDMDAVQKASALAPGPCF